MHQVHKSLLTCIKYTKATNKLIVMMVPSSLHKQDSHLEKSNQKNKEQDKSWSFCRVCFKFHTSYNDDSFCLQTTQKHTHAICNFIDWRKEWEKRCTDSVLFSALRCCRPKLLVIFVRHRNLLHRWKIVFHHNRLSTFILRCMRTVYPESPNFLDRGNHKFGELHSAVDNQLHTEAVGAEVNHYLEK